MTIDDLDLVCTDDGTSAFNVLPQLVAAAPASGWIPHHHAGGVVLDHRPLGLRLGDQVVPLDRDLLYKLARLGAAAGKYAGDRQLPACPPYVVQVRLHADEPELQSWHVSAGDLRLATAIRAKFYVETMGLRGQGDVDDRDDDSDYDYRPRILLYPEAACSIPALPVAFSVPGALAAFRTHLVTKHRLKITKNRAYWRYVGFTHWEMVAITTKLDPDPVVKFDSAVDWLEACLTASPDPLTPPLQAKLQVWAQGADPRNVAAPAT